MHAAQNATAASIHHALAASSAPTCSIAATCGSLNRRHVSEHEDQNPRDLRGTRGDSSEAEPRRDERDDEER